MRAQRCGRMAAWLIGLTVGILVCGAPAARAAEGSLWSKTAVGNTLLGDHRAKAPGDILTIIITEKADASQKAASSNKKDAGVSAGPGAGWFSFFPEVKVSGGDDLSATGATTRGGTLNAKLTVLVTDVLGNGSLLVEGTQSITVNQEKQKIIVRGEVRPEDISRDNTVLSTFVANAEITYLGDGVVGDKQKPGIISRFFSWLF